MENVFKVNESIAQQYNQSIKKMIEQLGDHLKSVFQKKEDSILTCYKDQLLKTRQEFNRLQEAKSQDAITKSVLQQKNQNEKECQNSLGQSLQISKTYEVMKAMLNQVQDGEHQLKLEIKYLQKQCQNIGRRRDFLKRELQILQSACQKENILENESFIQQFNQNKLKDKKPQREILGAFSSIKNKKTATSQLKKPELIGLFTNQCANDKQNNGFDDRMTNVKRDEQYERSMKNKIEQIKDFKQSVIQEQSSLDAIFSECDLSKQYSRKQKLRIIQQVFSREEVKEQIYELLFCEQQLPAK